MNDLTATSNRHRSHHRPTRTHRRHLVPRFLRSMKRLDLRGLQVDVSNAQIVEDLNYGRD